MPDQRGAVSGAGSHAGAMAPDFGEPALGGPGVPPSWTDGDYAGYADQQAMPVNDVRDDYPDSDDTEADPDVDARSGDG